MLREKKILNLGVVERAYIEACGILSIYKYNDPHPGLLTSPESDREILRLQNEKNISCCSNCGHIQDKTEKPTCEVCSLNCWTNAYILQES